MIAAVQPQGVVPALIAQRPVEAQTTQPLPFFPRMKENTVWAWTATVEKLETVGQNLKRLLLKVIEALREFFAPKYESLKGAAIDLYERFTAKPAPAATPVATPPEVAEAPVALKAPEEPPALAAPEPQNFVPVPLPEIAQPPEEPQVQMPVQASVIDEPPAAAAPAASEPEKVGIFNFLRNWFR